MTHFIMNEAIHNETGRCDQDLGFTAMSTMPEGDTCWLGEERVLITCDTCVLRIRLIQMYKCPTNDGIEWLLLQSAMAVR